MYILHALEYRQKNVPKKFRNFSIHNMNKKLVKKEDREHLLWNFEAE